MRRLKRKYKYIYFEIDRQLMKLLGTKHTVWVCRNSRSDAILATLTWDTAWKQCVATFVGDAIFSADCLADIVDFMKQL